MLNRRVETQKILDYLSALVQLRGNYLRLVPAPPPGETALDEFPFMGILASGSPYRTSLQASIWQRIFLLDLLQVHEFPWDFEVLAQKEVMCIPVFFALPSEHSTT